MARIRSLHPGFWTDEAVMTLSVECPLGICVLQGLWNEADDQGLFEWKPLVIKAKVLPAAPADVAGILERLEALRSIKSFMLGGKKYGAIRNFRKYQRPKTPNKVHTLPDDLRNWVGLGDGNSETVEEDFGNASEKAPQMEEEGGRRKDGGGSLATLAKPAGAETKPEEGAKPKPQRYPPDFEAFWAAYPPSPNASKADAAKAWAKTGGERPAELLECVAAFRRFLEAENSKRKPSDPYPVCHPSTWLNGKRWETYLEAAKATAARAAEAEAKRSIGLPACWRPAAEAYAARHGWPAWDAAVASARLLEGDPPTIEFDRNWSLNFARDHGVLTNLAKALGQEPDVVVKGSRS